MPGRWASVWFILLLVLLHYPRTYWPDQYLVASDVANQYPPFAGEGRTVHPPQNPILFDAGTETYPWQNLILESVRHGEIPTWTPYAGAGAPLLGNDQSAVFFPLNWLTLPLGLERAQVWIARARLAVAALAMFCFVSLLGASAWASSMGAVTFVMCGAMQLNGGIAIGATVCTLPAIMLGTEILATSSSRWAGLGLALAVGGQFVAGHPESTIGSMLLATVYTAWRLHRRPVGRACPFVQFVVFCSLGFFLSAIQTFPFIEYLGLCSRIRGVGEVIAATNVEVPTLGDLAARLQSIVVHGVLMVFPDILGSPISAHGADGIIPLPRAYPSIHGGTVPFPALALAFLALGSLGSSRTIRFFSGTAVAAYAAAMGIPPFSQIFHVIPLAARVDPIRLLHLLPFAIGVLAAFGLDDLAAQRARPGLVRFVSSGGLLVLAVTLGVLALGRPTILARGQSIAREHFESATPAQRLAFPLERRLAITERKFRNLCDGLTVPALIIGLTSLAFLKARHGGVRGRIAVMVLPALAAVEMAVLWGAYFPVVSSAQIFPRTPAIAFLEARLGPGRVGGLLGALPPNTATYLGMRDYRNYDGMELGSFHRLVGAFLGMPTVAGWQLQNLDLLPDRLLRLLAIQYVVAAPDRTLEGLDLVHDGPDARVYRPRSDNTRVRIVRRYRVMTDDEAVLAELAAKEFDPASEVILQSKPELPVTPGVEGRCTIESDGLRRVLVRCESTAPALLVLFDTYYPGWKAFRDGVEVPILRADWMFRAVAIPRGISTVEFVHDPASVHWGAGVSIVTVLILVACVVVGPRRRCEVQGPGSEPTRAS